MNKRLQFLRIQIEYLLDRDTMSMTDYFTYSTWYKQNKNNQESLERLFKILKNR